MNKLKTSRLKQPMKHIMITTGLLMLLAVHTPVVLQAATNTQEQAAAKPSAQISNSWPDLSAFEKKLQRFLHAFEAVKVQKANKMKDQLMPVMQHEVQHLNQQIVQLKDQLKQARKQQEPPTDQARLQALTEQLKTVSQRHQRMAFIHKHLKAYPFQARNIKTAGVVRKDMLLEFVELMKANRVAQRTNQPEEPQQTQEQSAD